MSTQEIIGNEVYNQHGVRLERDLDFILHVDVDTVLTAIRHELDTGVEESDLSLINIADSSFAALPEFNPQKAEIAAVFGIRTVTEASTYRQILIPTVETLNERRAPLIKMGLVNDGVFVEHEGGLIEPRDFAKYLAGGHIPVSTQPAYRIHDMLVHAAGYSAMAPGIFSMLKGLAQRAVDTQDPKLEQLVIDFAEAASITAAGGKEHNIRDAFDHGPLAEQSLELDWELAGLKNLKDTRPEVIFGFGRFGMRLTRLQRLQDTANRQILELGSAITQG